jgi:hypothetical protein
MSDISPVRLELLGEMIRRLQADVRSLRDEGKGNAKLLELHTERLARLLELHTERIASHETITASRLDQMAETIGKLLAWCASSAAR